MKIIDVQSIGVNLGDGNHVFVQVISDEHILICGGLLEAKKIAALAEAHYVTVAPHNPLGPVSTAAAVHFAASTPNFLILGR
jgi:L-alanine-DL-glutamate epimerase-like enolase superfamily enzyme